MLIRNGLVVDVSASTASVQDVLISDGRIAAVGPGLSGSPMIDASDRIVLPGFVDTHRHVWQTLVRSIAADVSLGQYIELVLRDAAPKLRPEDMYRGTLDGALECLGSGITTVQDYSGTLTFEHASAALDALRESGIRALFGYAQTMGGSLPAAADVEKAAGLGNDLVSVMLAPLGPSFSPVDEVSSAWDLARSLGLRIAVHVANGPAVGEPISLLRDNGLLGPDITFVHGNSLSDEELALIGSAGAAVAISPAVEARMGHGGPIVGRLKRLGVTTGLGVDVVSAVAGDMFSLMRATLMSACFGDVHVTPGDVLRMATVDGAAALGLADQIGSIEVGKHADLVLLRANDINLAGARDPISAVVTAAHPGNVETVIIGGRVVISR